MSERLHVFAMNTETGLRHTHLTRAQGEAPALPPLADWLGTAVETDEIELFPIRDLGDMMLSDYITMAFAPEALDSDDARRMNALLGDVLLVPERALGGAAQAGCCADADCKPAIGAGRSQGDAAQSGDGSARRADRGTKPRTRPHGRAALADDGSCAGGADPFVGVVMGMAAPKRSNGATCSNRLAGWTA